MQITAPPIDNKYNIVDFLRRRRIRLCLAGRRPADSRSRRVAIKEIRRDRIADESLLVEEMQHLSAIDHPNVVKFLHHCRDDKTLYLVMETTARAAVSLTFSKTASSGRHGVWLGAGTYRYAGRNSPSRHRPSRHQTAKPLAHR